VTLRAQLAEQSSTLLDNHPRIKELKAQISDLDKQIRDEAARLARSFENDARIAGARVESLQSSLDQLKQQAASTNGQDVELRALEREAKAQRDLLESYLAKYREATARDSMAAPADARIISRALVSNTPYFPKKLPIVLVATLAALFISAGFITTGELLAGNVYRTGAPIAPAAEPISTVAQEPAPKRRWLPKGFLRNKPVPEPVKAEPVVSPPATGAAAPSEPAKGITIDDIATALREAGEAGKRVAFISAAPGNGSTLTAIAVARALARDARVVMVDLALERPELASITLDPRTPGIADLVRGTASFAQIITRDRISRVQVVPAGRVGSDAATIFMSERLNIAIDALSRTYDHVVIDAGAAPYVPADRIARLASCGVLVAGDMTEEAANTMSDHLASAGFSDIAVFTGSAPTLDAQSIGSAAA
jgi:tyrosine-protein kinase Etk/Wzc